MRNKKAGNTEKGGAHTARQGEAQDTHNIRHMAGMEDMPGMRGGASVPPMQHGGMGMMMDMGGLRRRFWVCLVLAVPVLLLSPMMGLHLPFDVSFPGSSWLVAALGTLLYFYGGQPFLRGAVGELKNRKPAMMMLIALGITTAYVYSMYSFVRQLAQPDVMLDSFFSELATLVVVMLLGHWIEMRAISNAGGALEKLAALLPDTATLQEAGGTTREVPLQELRAGQTVLVKPGGRVPADGVVSGGSGSVDEAMVTGEAQPIAKKQGDTVIGGSQNGEGLLAVRVTGTGESGYLAQVAQLVSSAQTQKSRAETLADRVAGWLFYIALGTGLLAFVVWLAITSQPGTALSVLVGVLVIACPHALGLAVPLVYARATSLGAKNGLLLRSRAALENATATNILAMDKTGTLTEGRFRVKQVQGLGGTTRDDVLRYAAALEQGGSHPLAAGIRRAANDAGLKPAAATDVRALPGMGVAGTLDTGARARLVSAAALEKEGISYDKKAFQKLAAHGWAVSYLLLDTKLAGLIAQGDTVKPGAAAFVKQLEAQGIRPVMLTGDNEPAAVAVASSLGIPEYHAGLLPQDKQKTIAGYKAVGKKVVMVGDGVNDAPALAAADVGVAIGAGTDVAIHTADVVLVRSRPEDILGFLGLGRAVRRKIKQNLWWGAGYNIVALPLAAGVLAPVGITLPPAAGALLMSLSTVIVAINAFTLRYGGR